MSELSKSILNGAKEALDYARGSKNNNRTHKIKIPDTIDVRDIRNHLHMSRREFSEVFGFSIRTIEKWERGERVPEGPTRAYLIVIRKNPQAVKRALAN